ncbi:unnamed protein product [Tuber aestivum]|uniref:Uncharacterized protein n=1 Tax=Tuber aestivum TaxID=59557 RepID=A0A292Q228_9PEZI|nr:unnamed protein product [Tuber aestivum]
MKQTSAVKSQPPPGFFFFSSVRRLPSIRIQTSALHYRSAFPAPNCFSGSQKKTMSSHPSLCPVLPEPFIFRGVLPSTPTYRAFLSRTLPHANRKRNHHADKSANEQTNEQRGNGRKERKERKEW